MPGPQTVIENPILNGPFGEPTRHFRFGEDGITDEVVEGRRPSSYFVPIPKAKKKGGQLQFETEWTADRIEESRFINQVRDRISRWRAGARTSPRPSRNAGPRMSRAPPASPRGFSWRSPTRCGGGSTSC